MKFTKIEYIFILLFIVKFSFSYSDVGVFSIMNIESNDIISTTCTNNTASRTQTTDYRGLKTVILDIGNVKDPKTVEHTILVTVGAHIVVKIKGNPTTGYYQKMVETPESSVVKPINIDPEYVPDQHDKQMVGYGGTFLFNFMAISTGITSAIMDYARYFVNPPHCIFRTVVNFKVYSNEDHQSANIKIEAAEINTTDDSIAGNVTNIEPDKNSTESTQNTASNKNFIQ